jgi:hypothetical protein
MTNNVLRYIIPPKYGENGPIIEALNLIILLHKESDQSKEITLLIPTKSQLDGTVIDASLGSSECKSLSSGQKVNVTDSLSLKCETIRTFKSYSHTDIILCVFPSEKMLDLVDSMDGLEIAIIVPWFDEDADKWKKTWNPVVLGEIPSKPEYLIDNPVVEEAMKKLTKRVNLSTGLSHPRDKGAAVEILRILRNNGENFNPDALKAWALRNGWIPKGAEDLRIYAQAIIERKPIRGDSNAWNPNIINILRESAGK